MAVAIIIVPFLDQVLVSGFSQLGLYVCVRGVFAVMYVADTWV